MQHNSDENKCGMYSNKNNKQNKIEVYRGISMLERKADLWPKDFYPYLWNRQDRAEVKCHQMV